MFILQILHLELLVYIAITQGIRLGLVQDAIPVAAADNQLGRGNDKYIIN